EPVEDRLTPIDLDRQRIVRSEADDEIGSGVDRAWLISVMYCRTSRPTPQWQEATTISARARSAAISSANHSRYCLSAQVRICGGRPGRLARGRPPCIGI